MGRPKKIKEADPALKEAEKQALRDMLTPFAEWAWGKEDAQKVIDKYFTQVIDKQ
jgi:hypothetical protein